MKKPSRNTIIWICVAMVAAVVLGVGIALMLRPRTVRYGTSLITGGVIAFLAWKAFIKDSRDELRASRRKGSELQGEIDSLKKTIRDLDRELAEKNSSRLNVVGLNPILHVAVLNVDTSFVRPYVREEGPLTFNGALKADLQVEYGIKLEEVRFKYDEIANTLVLANFHPGIISFTRKQLNWEFAKSYKSRSIFGHELSDISDHDTDQFTQKMCEDLRADLEKEIDTRQVSEFDWLSPLITNQVLDVLRLMVGHDSLAITIANEDAATEAAIDSGNTGFVGLDEFRRILAEPLNASGPMLTGGSRIDEQDA